MTRLVPFSKRQEKERYWERGYKSGCVYIAIEVDQQWVGRR